ncbi:SAM-dependent methyltransferase [Nocardioides rotundus]|uniref:SAM-dependent methyltransferase n=1 Tax=Nocardioides rotundus TaxID=1774216 RepID=UPI001CBDA463|nr:class I SAM-dependent methyltransferase [Nocardioides rotundus]
MSADRDTPAFDRDYWEEQWITGAGGAMATAPPNPHLVAEVAALDPGTALEAGAGAGAEAIWLAGRGWRVTAADISAEALGRARDRARSAGGEDRITWVEADLSAWEPEERFDLVTTHYAHPSIPQLAFYARLAGWVAPGGSLLVVGHRQAPDDVVGHGHGHGEGGRPAPEASVTAASVAALVGSPDWTVVTAAESERVVETEAGEVRLADVVVRAVRRPH